MSIYTKGGDKGLTSLYDGKRVSKGSIRVDSYGSIDELGAALGVAKNYVTDEKMRQEIEQIQHRLFTVASNLATEDSNKAVVRIVEQDIVNLEKCIDHYMGQLGNPVGFIINGSGKASAFLHLARTICRRAERRIVELQEIAAVDETLIKYVNRLADTIYAMARFCEEEEVAVVFEPDQTE